MAASSITYIHFQQSGFLADLGRAVTRLFGLNYFSNAATSDEPVSGAVAPAQDDTVEPVANPANTDPKEDRTIVKTGPETDRTIVKT